MNKKNDKKLGKTCIWCISAAISVIPLLTIIWLLLIK